jgi:two-component system response regulator PilR (NtrC family)
MLIARVLVLTAILGAAGWNLYENSAQLSVRVILVSLGVAYGISLVNLFLLNKTKATRSMAYAQFGLDAIFATVAIYLTASPVLISLYLLLIVAAAIVLSSNGAVIVAAMAGLAYGLLTADIVPPLTQELFQPNPQEILGVYLCLVLIALVSGYLARQLELVHNLAEKRQRNVNELHKQQTQLFNDVSDGIITVDLEATITGINEAARAIVGIASIDSGAILGKRFNDAFRPHGIDGIENLLENGRSSSFTELTLRNPQNEEDERHINYSVKTITDSDGRETGRMIIFNDVSHLKDMKERLALHERMTKLLSDTTQGPADNNPQSAERIAIIGESPLMQQVFSLVERVAKSDASVLISGESGTGKELIAKAIHASGKRRNKPFVAINCGAIPDSLIESELFGHKKGAFTGAIADSRGLFRQAEGGTVFLDEIGELPLLLQTKLLRALQERTIRPVGETSDISIDVRIVAASNRDLKQEVDKGQFREDLFYRLNVVNLVLPPLRDRKDDIPLLVRHFVLKQSDPDLPLPLISPDALQLLMQHEFPGNIRELENLIERALVLGGCAVLPEHLPPELLGQSGASGQNYKEDSKTLSSLAQNDLLATPSFEVPINLEETLAQIEQDLLLKALRQADGVKKNAAELLGLNFRSFRYRLKKYELEDSSS